MNNGAGNFITFVQFANIWTATLLFSLNYIFSPAGHVIFIAEYLTSISRFKDHQQFIDHLSCLFIICIHHSSHKAPVRVVVLDFSVTKFSIVCIP